MPPTETTNTDNTKGKEIDLLSQRTWSVVKNQQLIPNSYVMKWNEGMLKQCVEVGKYYNEWVDHPKMRRVRMFDTDWVEAASFTPWWIVPCLYIPWGILEARLAFQNFTDTNSSHLQSVLLSYININSYILTMFLFIIGVVSWTLFEYFCHKHAFHWVPPKSSWNIVHFIGHGMHHITPTDKYRLVFPPAVSFPLGVLFRFIFYQFLFPFGIRSAIFGGFVVGYACYESVHYLSHHAAYGYFLQQRFIYHSAHHFNRRKLDKLFGVSSQVWDVVFNTM